MKNYSNNIKIMLGLLLVLSIAFLAGCNSNKQTEQVQTSNNVNTITTPIEEDIETDKINETKIAEPLINEVVETKTVIEKGLENPKLAPRGGCKVGYCWSNGYCCEKSKLYYCNNACYSTQAEAQKANPNSLECSSYKIGC